MFASIVARWFRRGDRKNHEQKKKPIDLYYIICRTNWSPALPTARALKSLFKVQGAPRSLEILCPLRKGCQSACLKTVHLCLRFFFVGMMQMRCGPVRLHSSEKNAEERGRREKEKQQVGLAEGPPQQNFDARLWGLQSPWGDICGFAAAIAYDVEGFRWKVAGSWSVSRAWCSR